MRLLVYGTLRRGCRANGALGAARFVNEVRLPGYDMFNLGGFPGIVKNADNQEGIVGEVYDLPSDVADYTIEQLDHYEGYFPQDEKRSAYLRRTIPVEGKETFVYEFNQPTDRGWYQKIPSGDWRNM